MKYFGVSAVLVAMLLVVGCGSKSVDSSSDLQKDRKEINKTDNVKDNDNVQPDSDNRNVTEGGFMDVNGSSTNDNNSSDNNINNNDINGYGHVNNGDSYNNGEPMLALNSPAPIYFDFDRYDVRQDMRKYIIANADYIKKNNVRNIVLQGNTDDIGGDEYNLALGNKRAISVRDALVLQGISRDRFRVLSFGSSKPVCTESTAECRAKNRRTEIVEKN